MPTTRLPGRLSSRSIAARLTWGTLRDRHADTDERRLLRKGLGGLVLFSRSLGARDEVRALVDEVRRDAGPTLRVAVDQEGGHIVRLRDGFTMFPSAMAIGATRSAGLAFAAARATARELAATGIDVVLAPVLDLAADLGNPTLGARTYAADPRLVSRLGAAAVAGYLAGGVLPVPKHFPGHGRTPLDSHLAQPIVRGGMAQLRRDLRPFEMAVRAGAPMLMTSHVTYAATDDFVPATLSPAVARLAREQLGFSGVLVTDAMVMDAITAERAVPDACVAAVAAGSDVVMALEPAAATIDAIAAAIDNETLSMERIESALQRVTALQAEGRVAATAEAAMAPNELAAHSALATDIARRSLTLAWDDGLLPLRASTSIVLVDMPSAAASPIEDTFRSAASPLAVALAARLPRLRVVTPDESNDRAVESAVDAASAAELVIIATRDAFASPAQCQLVVRLRHAAQRTMHVALRSPADVALEPRPRAAVAAYCDVPATVDALADALMAGSAAFPGRLPVALERSTSEASAQAPRYTLAPLAPAALAG